MDMFSMSTWDVANVTDELNVLFYGILINLNLNNHMWLVAPTLDSTAPEV